MKDCAVVSDVTIFSLHQAPERLNPGLGGCGRCQPDTELGPVCPHGPALCVCMRPPDRLAMFHDAEEKGWKRSER